MTDPTAPIALVLVPAAAEATARMAKRIPWVRCQRQGVRRALVRVAALGAGLVEAGAPLGLYRWRKASPAGAALR